MNELPDCLDNSCFFSRYDSKRVGVRTNGGCRCKIHDIKKAFHTQNQQLAAAKAEIEKLSPLVEIVSNQKQSAQQLEEQLTKAKAEIAELYFWLNHAHAWLDIDADYKDSPICEKITETLAKHKGE